MKPKLPQQNVGWHALLWIARITAVAAIVPLMQVVFTESGAGPQAFRAWIYWSSSPSASPPVICLAGTGRSSAASASPAWPQACSS